MQAQAVSAQEHPKAEKTVANTRFGMVTDKRVIFYASKGWFSGSSRVDIPIQHVTSVRIDIDRHVFIGLFFILMGVLLSGELSINDSVLLVFGGSASLVGFAVGVLLLWGTPTVAVNTAGTDLRGSSGWPWNRKEAEQFVNALRLKLFH